MTRNAEELLVGLLGVAGVVLVLGRPAGVYDFMLGLVIVIGIWLVSGLLARYREVPHRRFSRR